MRKWRGLRPRTATLNPTLPPTEDARPAPDTGASPAAASTLVEFEALLPTEPRARREVITALSELAPARGWEGYRELAQKWRTASKEVRLPLSRLTGPFLRSLGASLGADVAQRAEKTLDQLTLMDAAPRPDVKYGHIVWRTKYGARKHLLVVPDGVPGESIWSHTKLVGRWRGTHPPALRALALGDCELARHLSRLVSVTRVAPSAIEDVDFESQDLAIVASQLFDEAAPRLKESIAEICRRLREQGTTTIIWFDRAHATLHLPADLDAFLLSDSAQTESWLRTHVASDALLRVGRIGPLASPENHAFASRVGPYLLEVGDAQTEAVAPPGFTPLAGFKQTFSSESRGGSSAYREDFRVLRPDGVNAVRLCGTGSFSSTDWAQVASALGAGFVPILSNSDAEQLPPPFSLMPKVIVDGEHVDPKALTPQKGQLARRFAGKYLSPETAIQRLSFVVGLPSLVRSAPLVSVLCVSNRPELIPRCIATYRRQNYQRKELILVLNEASMPEPTFLEVLAEHPDITLLRSPPELSLGESLNRARAVSSGEYWTKMDDDDHYAENYLSDLVLACRTQRANVCGKGTFFTYVQGKEELFLTPEAPENDWSERFVHGGTILANRRDVEGIDFPPVRIGTDSLFLQQCALAGLRIYSADRYNFAYIRYARPGHHTYDVNHDRYLRHSVQVGRGLDSKLIDI